MIGQATNADIFRDMSALYVRSEAARRTVARRILEPLPRASRLSCRAMLWVVGHANSRRSVAHTAGQLCAEFERRSIEQYMLSEGATT